VNEETNETPSGLMAAPPCRVDLVNAGSFSLAR